jgi:hypothetical protein
MTTRTEDRQELVNAFRKMGSREGYHVNIPCDGRNIVVGLEDVGGRDTFVIELDGSRHELTPYAAENLGEALVWVLELFEAHEALYEQRRADCPF